jgi:hypothetical protein
MTQARPCSTGALWARFRFSVVGSLLSSPPAHGSLQSAIRALAEKTWSHPLTGRDVRVAAGTIARWYYIALHQPDDPVGALRRAVRNGKQEAFWGTLEGRLLKMLDGLAELTLDLLNQATQAWVEIEYNRGVHRETSCSPVARFAHAPDVLRTSPTSDSLRDAFRLEVKRSQRQSDGTISLDGVRFEIPARYRHFREISVRYARWDLGRVDLVDERSGIILAPIYPLDKSANADGRRAVIQSADSDVPSEEPRPRRAGGELPPLLKQILKEYSATGMPPAYLPKTSPEDSGEPS